MIAERVYSSGKMKVKRINLQDCQPGDGGNKSQSFRILDSDI